MNWSDLKTKVLSACPESDTDLIDRVKFELKEIEKQCTEPKWVEDYLTGSKYSSNPAELAIPWLLGMVDTPPSRSKWVSTSRYADIMKYFDQFGELPTGIKRDVDNPDIDIDCLPESRDELKDYAVKTFGKGIDDGYGVVCSVGTWTNYLLKSAIVDVAKATNQCSRSEAFELTTALPEDVDEMKEGGSSSCKECKTVHSDAKCPKCFSEDTEYPTLGKVIADYPVFKAFYQKYPGVIETAVNLVGKVRGMGKHAGALIIADRPLFGNIPMTYEKNGQWKSLWTEGRSTQLSKAGYFKWDMLGLLTLKYIFEATKMIHKNHGIVFGELSEQSIVLEDGSEIKVPSMSGWDDVDPETNRGGRYVTREGKEVIIDLNDQLVMELASSGDTDTIFQFDTPLAQRILKNGVRSFGDLMALNALGHPGPMDSIPEFIRRRDDPDKSWMESEDPRMLNILFDTFGLLVYQEQLQRVWQELAMFTSPEAQEARKAVAKKWRHKLKGIQQKWLQGASKIMPMEKATKYWEDMESFGRYAFNRCLASDSKLHDPTDGSSTTVGERFLSGNKFNMLSYDSATGSTFVDECVAIHDNGEQEVFEIVFDDGSSETVTAGHKFLCSDGGYHEVREIFEFGLDVVGIGAC